MHNLQKKMGCFASLIVLAVLSGIVLSGFAEVAIAKAHGYSSHHYPARGGYVAALPRDHHVFVHGGARYYFAGGAWYRPRGPRFLVVAPPIGLVVPFLPLYYSTIWVGGYPYYYANDVYYAPTAGGYVVVAPPQGAVVSQPPSQTQPQASPSGDRLFIYPRQNQSSQKQANDRYECHRWAVGQTGYDPTRPDGGVSAQKRADYQRAMGACLDGRGYTVR